MPDEPRDAASEPQALRERIEAEHEAGKLRPLAAWLEEHPRDPEAVARVYFEVTETSPTTTAGGFTGERLGPYQLIRELGRGGQGIVHLAQDTRLGRRVALKILRGRGEGSEQLLSRFRREAEVASRLDHPGICSVYESGIIDEVPFIAMRYVEGLPLSQWLTLGDDTDPEPPNPPRGSRRHRGLDEITRIIEGAARALHAAHEAGVLHRDVKPGNIIVTPGDEAVVLDFGLARDLSGDTPTLTQTGDFFGTPAYMAPEQLAPRWIPVDRRVDVWALGVTLYEALLGERPFQGPTHEALIRAIQTREPLAPRRLDASIPRDLEVVILCALEKDWNRRYQSAAAFADDLGRVRRLESISARRTSPLVRLARWYRRSPGTAFGISAALFFLSVGLVATFAQKQRADEKAAEAQANLAAWRRLADVRRVDDLVRAVDAELWPPHPHRIEDMRAWKQRVDEVAARLPLHRERLAALRTAARSRPSEVVEAERQAHPLQARLATAQRLAGYYEAGLRRNQEAAPPKPDRVTRDFLLHLEKSLERNRQEARELERHIEETVLYRFDDSTEQWQHDVLIDLVLKLETMLHSPQGAVAVIDRRLRIAERIDRVSLEDSAEAWDRVRAEIATDSRYGGLELAPQRGLIPLGKDPASGLQEFADVVCGEPVTRDPQGGALRIGASSGLVFVLVPGGLSTMGAQRADNERPHYDRGARRDEGPVIQVSLEPFFLSKFEMTQPQWLRATGNNPASYGIGASVGGKPVTATNPVENMDWITAKRTLEQLGYQLPTEAQWEYACRAGTDSRHPWGDDLSILEDTANLADEGSRRVFPQGWPHTRGTEDGHAIHAPIGSFQPNDWGFHDIIGNVEEWCADDYISTLEGEREPGTGLTRNKSRRRSLRGSSFNSPGMLARSARRSGRGDGGPDGHCGVRPARRVSP